MQKDTNWGLQFKNKIAQNLEFLYQGLSRSFATTLERLEVRGRWESHLRYADLSDLFIGHSGSTYWIKKDSEKTDFLQS